MPRKYENTIIRKKQIANAAAKIIVKYGSEHVTTKKIANEVGISETAIYRHFKGKREVLAFLIDDTKKTLLSEIEFDAGAEFSVETFETIINTHIKNIAQRKGVYFQVIAEIISLGQKTLNRQTYGVINSYINRISDILGKGRDAGVIRKDIDLNAAATLFFGMIQGQVNMWALSQYGFSLEENFLASWKIFRESILNK